MKEAAKLLAIDIHEYADWAGERITNGTLACAGDSTFDCEFALGEDGASCESRWRGKYYPLSARLPVSGY
jgi:hypothetical protein